ncbi:MAG: alpha/beta hydrolase [Azospirillaceae bacterium]
MAERLIKRDGVRICAEAFGDPADPPVLLIMGATASMLWWPDDFCRRLAGRGFFVVRYDNRDTGRSSTYPHGTTPYTLDDLAGDALLVLDDYAIARAQVIGMSLGGMLGQMLALIAPERVASLTMIASARFDAEDPDLPGIDPDFLAAFDGMDSVDWQDEESVVTFQLALARITNGRVRPFDEARMASLARREFRRADDLFAMFNHAGLAGGETWRGRLGTLDLPALVIHGTADPILPHPHGVALAAAVPGARLLTLEGAGHDLAPEDWPAILDAFADLASRAELSGAAP